MHLRLHKNATTTPRIRAEIQVSKEPMRVLAQRFGVSVSTIARWKKRASVHDASHTPHRLQTTLTPAQESIVLVLRKSLGLSLDDLLAVVREFIHPTVSRAALHRMLKRHGVSAREALSVASGPSSFRVEHNTHNDSWSSSPVGMCAGRWPACAHVHEACLIRRMSPWALP